MPCFEWEHSYSLGIQQIDHQHHHLFNSINALYDVLVQDKDTGTAIGVLDELASFVMSHFDTEEQYFSEFSYEKADEHKIQHEALCKKINDLRDNLQKGKHATFTGTVVLLAASFCDHIQKYDREYVQCLNENGIY